jgi:hypothetical protein
VTLEDAERIARTLFTITGESLSPEEVLVALAPLPAPENDALRATRSIGPDE